MSQQQWTAVDAYLNDLLAPSDAALDGALARSEEAGLPAIQVAPNQGKLLAILAKSIGARRILEIGTLGGYSTIWLARSLPADGRLVTLEKDPKHAEVARTNIAAAGLAGVVEFRVGAALAALPLLAEAGEWFDLVFIDADKANNPAYFDWALKLTHPGSLIICDNVVRNGRVVDAGTSDANTVGSRAVLSAMAAEPRVTATAIQTVGDKGYDGLAIAFVNR